MGRQRGWALVAFLALGVIGALAYLASGPYVLLLAVLIPKPGTAEFVIAVKVVTGIVWAGIGIWTFFEFWRRRWRFLAGPPAAWAWTYGAAVFLQGSVVLNFGY